MVKLISVTMRLIKGNVVKLSTIYVHNFSDSITTQSISQMTHFFCLKYGPLDPKVQNPGENTVYYYIVWSVIR